MKNLFRTTLLILTLSLCWGSSAQKKERRDTSRKTLKSFEKTTKVEGRVSAFEKSKVKNEIQLISPKERSVENDNKVNFAWKSTQKNAVLTVLNVDPDRSLNANVEMANVALQIPIIGSKMHTATNLKMNQNYIWSVTTTNNLKGATWNTFFLTDMDVEDGYFESCEGNLVADSDFSKGKGSVWSATGGTQLKSTSMGCDNLGFTMLSSQVNSSLKQSLKQSTVVGRNYALGLCMVNGIRNQKKNTILTVVAYKGTPTSFETCPDVSIIYKSANIANSKDWLEFETPAWTATAAFDKIAFLVSSDDGGKEIVKLGIDNICFGETLKDPCDTEYEISLDNKGGYTILDKGLNQIISTHSPKITETYQDYNRGPVSDLYGYRANTDTDMFYDQFDLSSPCFSVGGYDPTKDFEEIDRKIDTLEQQQIINRIQEIAPKILKEKFLPDGFDSIVDVGRPCDYVDGNPSLPFGGADIVYVHGLALEHITEGLSPNQIHQKFKAEWPNDAKQFYGGDYKVFANNYWEDHIQSQITNSQGLTNRYMTVAWPSDQRLGDAIHAVLQQVSTAIRTGEGVIFNKEDSRQDSCFGDRIVFVSHSTGGLLVSSLLGVGELAKTDRDIQRAYGTNIHNITDRVVGQVALSGAFSGSKLASAAIVAPKVLGSLVGSATGLGGVVAHSGLRKYNNVVMNSVLVDLIPPISQNYWAKKYFHLATKPTLTVSGSTPGLPQNDGMGWAGKFLIRGYNDGVLSMDCQCGSDQKWWLRSSFLVNNPFKMWDWGNPFVTKALGLSWDARYYTALPLSPFKGSACIPFLTPAGMLTPFSRNVSGTSRWDNHYSLIQSTMTHFDPTREILNLYPNNSPSVVGFINNYEESRVVTNSSLYANGYVENSFKRIMNEQVRKKSIGFHFPAVKRTGKFPFFKMYLKYYEIVIWKRTYHLMRGHQNKNSADYVYEYAFRR